MRAAGQLIYDSLLDSYYAFSALVAWNLLWALGTLLVITAPPALAGLCYATHELAHQQPVTWLTFMDGFRKYFWLGWRWGLLNLAVVVGVVVNGQFYSQFDAAWSAWVRGAFLGAFLLWVLIQAYVFPLLFEQEQPSLRTALRNSLVLWLRRPGFGVGLAAFLFLLIVVSTLIAPPAWFLVTASLCAYLANRGVLHLLGDLNSQSQAGRVPDGLAHSNSREN